MDQQNRPDENFEKLDPVTEKNLLAAQRNEITEHYIYEKLSRSVRDEKNRKILRQIADDELAHHNICNTFTCREVRPNRFRIWLYFLVSRIFGLTFGLKLMERGEEKAHAAYQSIAAKVPSAAGIASDETRHGHELINMIDDERLRYTGDIVRGLNVAIVELTGALAGLTLAFENRDLVLVTGIILSVTMSLSVASTEYLASKTGFSAKNPVKSVVYAGLANIITSLALISPYFVFENTFASLGFMVMNAVIAIFVFSFYNSVAAETSFRKRFLEMVAISLGIAVLAFLVGLAAREILHLAVH